MKNWEKSKVWPYLQLLHNLREILILPIPDNSDTKKSNPGINPGITTGIMTDTPSTQTFPEQTDVTAIHAENPEELQIFEQLQVCHSY